MSFDKSLQKINIPPSFTVTEHEFYTYDPTNEYSEEASEYYLSEDLFQVLHGPSQLIVDVGWYGDISKNKGQYVLKVITNEFWDEPVSTIYITSQSELTNVLNKTLEALDSGILDFE